MPLPNHFDRGKPFYPLVMNYLVQLFGFKDFAIAGLPNVRREFTTYGFGPTLLELHPMAEIEAKAQLEKLTGPLELRCEIDGGHINVDADELAYELVGAHRYLIQFLMRSAGSLLILAHEVSKDEPWHDQGPLWEFLRHCRNAAAHGGPFTFRNSEPRRPATWGRLVLEPALAGTPLFKGEDGVGLLSPGDPIKLLWDIEQAYTGMRP